jgi:glycogen operon protein
MIHGSIGPGSPEPLGVFHDGEGVNVAVVSAHGTAVDFCIFDESGNHEIERIRLPERTGDVYHGRIDGLAPETRYGLRVHGPWEPEKGHRFNPAKLLVDPYAVQLDRPFRLDPTIFDRRASGAARDDRDSAGAVPKGIVEAPTPIRPVIRPKSRPRDRVIYELHVKGFTRLHPDVPPDLRGTFAGLGHPAVVDHLVRLGVDVIEIMPIWAGVDERHLAPLGLSNYWGYNPIALNAPDPRLAPGGWGEVREAIDALHDAGISVILDVVLNHTGESDHLGPTLSFRGLDNALYYRLAADDPTHYVDDAGCGNVPALDRQAVMRLGLDALRTAALRGGFDGFRYDLATTLGRKRHGFDANAPFLAALEQDPVLRGLIHVAEPWDIGPGGYRLGAFPANWGEWNDRWRDCMRRFWRGDEAMIGEVATRFAGSGDVFGGGRRRRLSDSVNFITAHDGFTLADLVSYSKKHNRANGEDDRDGTDANHSWNHGAEGPTSDPAILTARARDVRALIATLLTSRGTPMLSMGDELGRTQQGNNNAYAQDNEISWLDWSRGDTDLSVYTARAIALRRAHPALTDDRPLTGEPVGDSGLPDVEWTTLEGHRFSDTDWHDPETFRVVAVFAAQADDGTVDRVAVVLSPDPRVGVFVPPPARPGHRWRLALDSAHPYRVTSTGAKFAIDGRSVAVVVEEPVPEEAQAKPVDALTLDKLARAAGIAADWWDLSGNVTRVGDDTKRAILTAMGLAAGTVGEARDSLDLLLSETCDRPLPLAHTIFEGRAFELPLGPVPSRGHRSFTLTIETEAGETSTLTVQPGEGRIERRTTRDGRIVARRWVRLPDLPVGRHRVHLDRPEVSTALVVAPATCHLPEALMHGRRRFGIAGHLYSWRHDGDQGIGDFTTLRQAGVAAAQAGASTLGINPIHALFPQDRERASPYSPSDRRFLDPIYIDVTRLPAALQVGAGPEVVRTALEFPRLARLDQVDYSAVWAAKSAVLRAAFSAFQEVAANRPSDPLVLDFAAFRAAGGEGLARFATFEAIAAVTGATSSSAFPADLATAEAAGVAAFREKHARAVSWSMFLQWLAARQMSEAASRSREAGLDLGFYRDLAVGCAPDGAEAWGAGASLMRFVSVGAPPDPLGPDGQVWSLPPPNPIEWARNGFASFAELVRANMAHAGALRIDHVLGLRRLFVVPDGMRGAQGAYVDMPFEDLLGQLTLESRRAGCLVVGEDLGTVPHGFRERMAEARVLSYQVLWFEHEGQNFKPPEHYPSLGAACVSTHDLPTLAGWWEASDIAEREALELLDAEDAVRQSAARVRERRILLGTLVRAGLLEDRWSEEELPERLPDEVAVAVHAWLGRASSALALVQADDLAGEVERLNLPGTDRERPNWRRRLHASMAEIFADPTARAILDGFAARRRDGA